MTWSLPFLAAADLVAALLICVVSPQALPQATPLPAPPPIVPQLVYTDTGRTVDFPGGTVKFYAPIEFKDRDDVIVNGNDTTLEYAGPPCHAPFVLARMTRASVSRLKLRVTVPGVKAFVLVTNLPGVSPDGRVSTGCRFSDVWLDDGGHKTVPLYGFDVDQYVRGGADGNNDMHEFVRCRVQHYTRAAWHFNGTQIHQISLDRCTAVNVHRSPNAAGVWCEDGGYFTARDCAAWGNAVDFEMKNRPNRVTVSNFNSEHAKRLFDLGTTGAKASVAFRDVRWDGEPEPEGNPTMRLFGLGPIVLDSVWLNGINGVAPTIVASAYSAKVGNKWVMQPGTLTARGVTLVQWPGKDATPSRTFRVPATWQFSGDGLVFGRIMPDGSQPDERLFPERY